MTTAAFDDFWTLYPRKTAKIAARKAWEKHKCDGFAERILAALKRQLPHWTESRFIPHPASWLNAGRWDDELHVEVRAAAAKPTANYNPPPQSDGWKANINRVLMALVYRAGGVPDDVLARLLKGRDYYAQQFREMWGDTAPPDDFTPIMQNVVTQFRRVIAGGA